MFPKVRKINRNLPDRWQEPFGWDRDFNSHFESLEELLEVLQESCPEREFYIDEDGRLYEREHVAEWALEEEGEYQESVEEDDEEEDEE